MAMQMLTVHEMNDVSGGFVPLTAAGVGAASGLATYAGSHLISDQPMTWQGATWAAGQGALLGATGGALMAATGGGLAAQLAWRPGMPTVGFGAGQYPGSQGW